MGAVQPGQQVLIIGAVKGRAVALSRLVGQRLRMLASEENQEDLPGDSPA